jgi:hypothetical protein
MKEHQKTYVLPASHAAAFQSNKVSTEATTSGLFAAHSTAISPAGATPACGMTFPSSRDYGWRYPDRRNDGRLVQAQHQSDRGNPKRIGTPLLSLSGQGQGEPVPYMGNPRQACHPL